MTLNIPERLGGLHYSKSCERSRPIGRDDIVGLESEIGARLPEEYAEFLLRHPLGPVEFGKKRIFCRNENGRRVFVSTFYSIVEGSACPGLSLWDQFDPLGEMTPRHLLPINLGDACGNNVCIAVTGASEGTVFSWEHELYDYSGERPWLEPWELAVAAVAPSFSAFLESLEVDPSWD
jgi:SMI1 / KNR4 family (SUKH-1)